MLRHAFFFARPSITYALPVTLPALHNREAAQTVFDQLQQQARAAGVVLRAPPAEPTTCCGRGCNGCVWEGFLEAAEYWRQEALLMLDDGPA